MVKNRYLKHFVEELCFDSHKMAFISGPRQCGKTTLAKQMLRKRGKGEYFTWDEKQFRQAWAKNPLVLFQTVIGQLKSKPTPIVILDEIHKQKLWKRNIKGVYDSIDSSADIVVTGSAKLNVYRRGSDSLMGRYYHFRLHPFSLAELLNNRYTQPLHEDLLDYLFDQRDFSATKTTRNYYEQLKQYGPFPEPLFAKNPRNLRLWQRNRIERLVFEDLQDISRGLELSQIEILVSMLPERVASPLSLNALREDLEVSHDTVKRWVNYLKEIYYLFEVKPYAKSIPRAIKKEGKAYLWDWSEVEEAGARFENLIASHLLKYTHLMTDIGEANLELTYLKNREKQEIDFLLVKDKKPWLAVEAKLSDTSASTNWDAFFKHLPIQRGIQIIEKNGVFKHIQTKRGEVLILSAEYILPLLT